MDGDYTTCLCRRLVTGILWTRTSECRTVKGTVTIDRVPNPDEYTYDQTLIETYNPMTVIKVSPPKLSTITVVGKTADSGEVRDVKVRYRVRAAMIDNSNG